MKASDDKLIWEAMAPQQPTNELNALLSKALKADGQLPDTMRDEDYNELKYNFMEQVKNFIDEIEIKISNSPPSDLNPFPHVGDYYTAPDGRRMYAK